LQHINMMDFPKLRHMLHTSGYRITKITTNRTKWVSYAYLPMLPICYLMTRLVFLHEVRSQSEKRQNREILRQLFSVPVLFGEVLAVRAQKVS
jgi:hypothetical protein